VIDADAIVRQINAELAITHPWIRPPTSPVDAPFIHALIRVLGEHLLKEIEKKTS
jgi:hypothetical protein